MRALGVQLMRPLDRFFIILRHRVEHGLVIDDHHAVSVDVRDAERVQQIDADIPRSADRNFVGLAVAVRISFFERFEYLVQLICVVRNIKAELIQPCFVDNRLDRCFRP